LKRSIQFINYQYLPIIEHECSIGNFSHIAPGAVLAGNVSIGSGCLIGANSVIKQGLKVGDNVIIGAEAVVLKDINSNTKIVGNPAREIKRI
jgi:acetyltransferase-like isoleucine patch superfamily enzyme